MKFNILHFLSIFLLFSCKTQKTEIEFSVLNPYCGGAKPTEEMEKEAQTLKPYANKKVYYKSDNGETGVIETDENGRGKLKVKDGKYYFYEEWRYNKKTPNDLPAEQFDETCLKAEWNVPHASAEAKGGKLTFITNDPFINYCEHQYPCVKGEHLPPMRE